MPVYKSKSARVFRPFRHRYDNKTKICDKCGLTEALWDFFEHEKKTTN